MSEFKIPPISTLIGSNLHTYFKVIKFGKHIDTAYYLKYSLTTAVVFLLTPLRIYEKLYFKHKIKKYKIEKEPLFILGHWRSGTTFLHNLLCVDKESGYCTTYHSVFPNNLATGFLLKRFMKLNMPDKRPSDNMKLGIDLPQEDEFAIGNVINTSFYNFFYFPENYKLYFKQAIDNVNDGNVPEWDVEYRKLIVKALINTNGKRAIIKNPVNSARIKSILRVFPNAKFVFLYRNPINVFLSTQKFFHALFPTLWFHKVNAQFIDDLIFYNYKRVMEMYNEQKHLIPSGNIIELRYEQFEQQPLKYCESIFSDLLQSDFEMRRTDFEDYLSLQKGYKKNQYQVSSSLIDRMCLEFEDYMKEWNYNIPDDLLIKR